MKSIEDRYRAKVQQRGPDECWPWIGAHTKKGYGIFRDENGRARSATRWAYGRFVGPIAEGLDLCHTCDNPPCHNPAHWWVGTRRDNLHDMIAKGRYRGGSNTYGEASPNAKLTDAQRADIQRRRPTTTLRVLAEEYGVTTTGIWHVANSPYRYDKEPAA